MKLKLVRIILTRTAAICLALGVGVGSQAAPLSAQDEPPPGPARSPSSHLTSEQLQQLVAPIALYPDALVAQILAAPPTRHRLSRLNASCKKVQICTARS